MIEIVFPGEANEFYNCLFRLEFSEMKRLFR